MQRETRWSDTMHKTFSCRQFFTQQNSNQPSKGTCANMMKESMFLVSRSPLCEKQENYAPTPFSRHIAACVPATNTYLFSRSNVVNVTFSNWLMLFIVNCSSLETVVDVAILMVGCCSIFDFLLVAASSQVPTHAWLVWKLASSSYPWFVILNRTRYDVTRTYMYHVPRRRPKNSNLNVLPARVHRLCFVARTNHDMVQLSKATYEGQKKTCQDMPQRPGITSLCLCTMALFTI